AWAKVLTTAPPSPPPAPVTRATRPAIPRSMLPPNPVVPVPRTRGRSVVLRHLAMPLRVTDRGEALAITATPAQVSCQGVLQLALLVVLGHGRRAHQEARCTEGALECLFLGEGAL